MQIEHISRSYRRQIRNRKNVCSFRRSTGCFNQQSLLWSASPACVTTTLQPVDESTQVNSTKVNAVLKSQRRGSKLKVNAAAKWSTLWPRFLCQVVRPFKNQTSHKFSAWLDHGLTKVNAGQTFCKTLAAETLAAENPYSLSSSSFPRVAEIRPPGSSYSLGWERKMWVVLWWNSLQLFLYLYPSMRVCDTSVGHVSLHYKTGWPCTYNLLRIINSKYKFCSSD